MKNSFLNSLPLNDSNTRFNPHLKEMIKRRLNEKEEADTILSNSKTTRGISAGGPRRRNIGQFNLTTGRNTKSNKSGDLTATPKILRKPQTETISPREDVIKK